MKSPSIFWTKAFMALFISLFFQAPVFAQQILREASPNGKYIGTIANKNFFRYPGRNEQSYLPVLTSEFNSVVAEEDHKMLFMIPNRPSNPFNLKLSDINTAALDKLINLGNAHSMVLRGHALIWHNQAPEWLISDARNWNNDQIYAFTRSYITHVMNYTQGKIQEWDVFNEVILDGNNERFRSGNDIWYSNVNSTQNFIDSTFRWAHEADPNALLFYNDYNVERYSGNSRSKNRFMLRMVQGMKNRGVPIHGVGLQAHFESGKVNNNFVSQVERTMDTIIDMGLIANITELDLRICDGPGNPSPSELNTQRNEYKALVEMALSKEGSTGLTMWGFTDQHSWMEYFFEGCEHALVFDRAYNKKPAYQGVLEALQNLSGSRTQSPFFNAPAAIPGKIEFENYDRGGAGVAYSDRDPANRGGSSYRSGDGVDISDIDNSTRVLSFTEDNEWLEYTVNIQTAGTYSITFSYASASAGTPKLRLSVGGTNVMDTVEFQPNGDWATLTNMKVSDVSLPSGVHAVRVAVEEGAINLDSMSFNNTSVSRSLPGVLEAETYDAKSGSVRVENTPGTSSGRNLGYIRNGDYVDYRVNVSTSGDYVFDVYASSRGQGGNVEIFSADNLLGSIEIPFTGSWHDYVRYSTVVNLPVGQNTLRLVFRGGSGYLFNLDRFSAEALAPVSSSVSLTPIHDAYLEGDARNNSGLVRIEQNRRTGYLMFDLAEINGTVTKAELSFTVAGDSGNGILYVNKGESNNWSETSLSNANKPAKGAELGSLNGNYPIGVKQMITLDAREIYGNRLSVILDVYSGNDFAFGSKENGGVSAPTLELEYAR